MPIFGDLSLVNEKCKYAHLLWHGSGQLRGIPMAARQLLLAVGCLVLQDDMPPMVSSEDARTHHAG
jgi:hypothetical protein